MSEEWLLLQKQHEHYEFAGLALKALAIALFAFDASLLAWLLAVLWLQDGIFKTFQARLGARLLKVEQGLRGGREVPMQLHSDWMASRPGQVALMLEYLKSAARPTVAFPYVALIALNWLF